MSPEQQLAEALWRLEEVRALCLFGFCVALVLLVILNWPESPTKP